MEVGQGNDWLGLREGIQYRCLGSLKDRVNFLVLFNNWGNSLLNFRYLFFNSFLNPSQLCLITFCYMHYMHYFLIHQCYLPVDVVYPPQCHLCQLRLLGVSLLRGLGTISRHSKIKLGNLLRFQGEHIKEFLVSNLQLLDLIQDLVQFIPMFANQFLNSYDAFVRATIGYY